MLPIPLLSLFVAEELADGDLDKKTEIEKHWNKAGARVWAKNLDRLNNPIVPFPNTSIPGDLFNMDGTLRTYMDVLSHQVAASEGRQEAANETGVL